MRQSGKAYIDKKRNEHPEVVFKYVVCKKCPFKCSEKITHDLAKNIHQEFWCLSDSEKNNFYDKTTRQEHKKRVRKEHQKSDRPRSFSFLYFFSVKDSLIRVCRNFYLSTLGISSRRIHYFHKNKKIGVTSTPQRDMRGKKTKPKVSEMSREFVKQHINCFPRIPAHYCRQNSQKEYLEQGLNLRKLYELYLDYCKDNKQNPVKFWLYSKIFNENFNIDFYVPKKDQCDLCFEFANQTKNYPDGPAEELDLKYKNHINEKDCARKEKNEDKTSDSKERLVVVFDLQRVINCPQTSVSKAYYLQKLNLYNLTACDIKQHQGYCILWNEGIGGRSGNDIASALIHFLINIMKNKKEITQLGLWSDSCVPQNKNSLMSLALLKFLNNDPNHKLQIIEQKFQEPGHSCVQEVDAIHSVIDRQFLGEELHSPLSVVRKLLKIRTRQPYILHQMQTEHFKDFKSCVKLCNFKDIPYKKIKHIIYTKNSEKIQYRTTLTSKTFNEIELKAPILKTRKSSKDSENFLNRVIIPQLHYKPALSKEKITAIRSLFNQFCPDDKIFWTHFLNEIEKKKQ